MAVDYGISHPSAHLVTQRQRRPLSASVSSKSRADLVGTVGGSVSDAHLRRPKSAGGPRGWRVACYVPRTFDAWAAAETVERLDLKWGPKEKAYRQDGLRQAIEDAAAKKVEAERWSDGKFRRSFAEAVRRQEVHYRSGQPFRSARHSGISSLPGHLAKTPGATGLFSEMPLLEATESAARFSDFAASRADFPIRKACSPRGGCAARCGTRDLRGSEDALSGRVSQANVG